LRSGLRLRPRLFLHLLLGLRTRACLLLRLLLGLQLRLLLRLQLASVARLTAGRGRLRQGGAGRRG